MFVKIKKNSELIVEGKVDRIDSSAKSIFVFNSPCSWKTVNLSSEDIALSHNNLAYKFADSCVLSIDHGNNKLYFSRDIPGNSMVYYAYSSNTETHLISDSILKILQECNDFTIDFKRTMLFLNNRKHYHLNTAFKNVEILLPGFGILIDLASLSINAFNWYDFMQPIKRMSLSEAANHYRESIDNSIREYVDTDRKTALMFSGGSDSALLLERMVAIGIKDLTLFHVKIKGKETEYSRALRTARHFNTEFITIEIDPDQIVVPWFEKLKKCYICLSDVRYDGMFAASTEIYKHLREKYGAEQINVVWGLQHSIAAPGISIRLLLKNILLFLAIYLKSKINFEKVNRFVNRRVFSSLNIDSNNSPAEQLTVLHNYVSQYLNTTSRLSQLINLKILFSNARKKEFSIERQNFLANELYPECRNIFPFYSRRHQEENLNLSILARLGGIKGLLKGTRSYKSLTLRAFQTSISAEYLIGGTKAALKSWRETLQTEHLYHRFRDFFAENASDIKPYSDIVGESIESYEKFKVSSNLKIELLTGLVMLLAKKQLKE